MILDKFEIKIINKLQKYNINNICNYLSKPFNIVPMIFLYMILYFLKIITIKEIFFLFYLSGLVYVIKLIFKRRRPYNHIYIKNNETDRNKYITKSYSFPSGHASQSIVFYLIMINKYKQYKLLGLIPILVGFSRICLGVHYPSDIIGGFIFGSIYFSQIKKYL